MLLLTEAANALGGWLLQIAIGLLIEELTFAGLARLVLASRAGVTQPKKRNRSGENPCSH
jgi:hypothetical protein